MITSVLALVLLGLFTVISAEPQSGQYGALAIDSNQGDQWGWAVNQPTLPAASQRAIAECGGNCRLVMTFIGGECAALAADQAQGSTIYGWAKEYDSSAGAQNRAMNECRQKGGTACIVRVWGCNSR